MAGALPFIKKARGLQSKIAKETSKQQKLQLRLNPTGLKILSLASETVG
jgi:hypothetical protein